MIIQYIAALLLLLLAVYSDIKTRKIKNIIVLPFCILGIVINFILGGKDALYYSLLGVAIPIVTLFVLFILKMLGAGDIKLLAAIGAVLGSKAIIYVMIFSFLAGGIMAVFVMALRRNALERAKHLFDYIKSCVLSVKIEKYHSLVNDKSGVFRFSYAIAAGTLFMLSGIQL
jgi:prepilin peptidase CpaA